MGLLTVRTNTFADAGSTHLHAVRGWKECRYGDAKDRDAKCILRLDMDSDALPHLQSSRVLTLRTDEPATPLREYRIPHRADTWESAEAVITAVPLVQDLNRILVTTTIGGLPTQVGAFSQLLLENVIDTYILPSLAAYGVTWIERGTISDTRRRSLAFNNATCLGLLDQFVEGTDYWVRLVPRFSGGGLVAYQITVTDHNAAAVKPRFLVGGNVAALTRQIDGVTQASVIIPQGAVPNGGDRPGDIGEYGVEITAVPNGTQVTVADPENAGSVIRFTNQHDGLFLEKMFLPRLVWPEDASPTLNPSAGSFASPQEVAYAVTPGTLWVSASYAGTGNGDVYVYDAVLGALVDRITVDINPRGVLYDPVENKVFVACEGSDSIKVFNATTRALITTIALTAGDAPRWLARSPVTADLYVACTGNGQVRRIDATGHTVVSSVAVTLTFPGELIYASGIDRLFALSSSQLVKIDPSAMTASTLSNTFGQALAYDSDEDEVWVFNTNVVPAPELRIIDGTAFTVTTALSQPFGSSAARAMAYDSATGKLVMVVGQDLVYFDATTRTVRSRQNILGSSVLAGFSRLSGPIDERLFLTIQNVVPSPILTLVPATETFSIRREITASDATTQRETMASSALFAVGDRVFYRKDASGVLRTTISDPAVVASMVFPREIPVSAPTLRAEHNYVQNAFLRDVDVDAVTAPGWDRQLRATTGNPETEIRWKDGDLSAWTAFDAQADGAHSPGDPLLNLKGLTPGDVLQVGDSLGGGSHHIASRAVVDGSGEASVKVTPATGVPGALSDSGLVQIRRSGIRDTDFYVEGQGAVLPFDAHTAPGEISAYATLPYLPSRTMCWCAVEVAVWRQSFNPSQHMRFEVRQHGTVIDTDVLANQDVLYTDHAVQTYLLSCLVDVTAPMQLQLALLITDQLAIGVAYVKRFWATLGPELVQTPAIEENANGGQLFHLGLAKAIELSNPGISYRVELLEDDPHAPVVEGAYAFLQDPEFGVAAQPRIISVERFLQLEGDPAEPRNVIVGLSNRARDLTGMLLDIASGNVSVVVNQSASTALPPSPAPVPPPGSQPPPAPTPPPPGPTTGSGTGPHELGDSAIHTDVEFDDLEDGDGIFRLNGKWVNVPVQLEDDMAGTPDTRVTQISTANTNRDGGGTVTTVWSAGANGSKVKKVKIKAQATSAAGAVRLYLNDGTNVRPLAEFLVPALTVSTTVSPFERDYVPYKGIHLPTGWSLQASTHNAETFTITVEGVDLDA